MSLKTYTRDILDVIEHAEEPCCGPQIEPGTSVRHKGHPKSYGTIIAIGEQQVTILWSVVPSEFDLSKFTFPLIRRVHVPLVANELVGIQPMTRPVASIFFFDYMYGSEEAKAKAELDKKCNEGPLLNRIYWRIRTCFQTYIPRYSSSLRSWLGSLFSKRITAGNKTSSPKSGFPKRKSIRP